MSDTSAHSAAAIARLTERVTSILEPLTTEFKELVAASKEVKSYEGCGPRLSTVMGSLVQPISPPIEDEAVITDHQRVCNTTQSVENILSTFFKKKEGNSKVLENVITSGGTWRNSSIVD